MAWAPSYVQTVELAQFMRIDDNVDDAQLTLAISAASRAVDNHTNRQFGVVAATEQRIYTAEWDRRRCRWIVEIDDLMNDTITVTVAAGEITAYTLEPVNAAQQGKPWTHLVVDPDSPVTPTRSTEHGVTIDAVWGWAAVPEPIEQATLLQASRFHSRRFSPYGVAGSPELGSEMRLLARVDPDVAVALSPFVRWWAAV